jgi:hypothetical protein
MFTHSSHAEIVKQPIGFQWVVVIHPRGLWEVGVVPQLLTTVI